MICSVYFGTSVIAKLRRITAMYIFNGVWVPDILIILKDSRRSRGNHYGVNQLSAKQAPSLNMTPHCCVYFPRKIKGPIFTVSHNTLVEGGCFEREAVINAFVRKTKSSGATKIVMIREENSIDDIIIFSMIAQSR